MKRDDWRARLRSYLQSQEAVPFVMGGAGGLDCGSFAGGAVEAMTGTNPHAAVAGKYKTMKGALRALKRKGFADHVEYAASVLTEIDPLQATYGDIAAVPGTDGLALGVVTGAQVEVRAPQGKAVVPLTDAVRAFRA